MPPGFAVNTGSYSRFRLLEGSVSLTLHNIQLSLGKQSNWLGPGESGPLLMSDNAEPVTMLKIDNTSPFHLPGFSRLLGPAEEFFIGQPDALGLSAPTLYGPNVNPQPLSAPR
jgi:hypothetical protein